MKGLLVFMFAWLVVIVFDHLTSWNLFESFVIVILGFLFIRAVEANVN